MMQKILKSFLIAAIAVTTIVPQSIRAAETTIRMTADGFVPQEITVQKGDTVIFKNEDDKSRWPASNLHPTHEIYPEFDPKQGVEAGASWSFTFTKPGTWKFHDHIFPQFSGTIIVEGEADAPMVINEKVGFWGTIWNAIKDAWYWLTHFGKSRPKNASTTTDNIDASQYNLDIAEGDEKIFSEDIALGSHLKKYGAQKTITALRLMEPKFGSCHQPAHRAGRIGYKIFGNKAFIEYSAECQSGYYHGAMEGYFSEYNSGSLKDSLTTLCQGGTNSFFEHQCVHGIGHGVMAWTNYELLDALEGCDELPKRQDSCWTGVFMENFVAKPISEAPKGGEQKGNGETDFHYTKYLTDDPQYPCNWVAEKYKSSCYFLQTSRMLQIFGTNFQKVAEACAAVPKQYQHSCFGSMGRDVGGSFPKDMAREIKECGWVSDQTMRIECLNGAVQNSFWDPTGQDLALEFCRLLVDGFEKRRCYETIFARAPEVIFAKADLESFCRKPEGEYQAMCRQYIP